MPIVLLVDLDSFYASVEERENAAIAGKPVVVCVYTRGGESGAVATANYPARKLGIKSGIPLFLAKKRANAETVFLPVRLDYYNAESAKIMKAIGREADVLEQVSVDEAYLDVSKKCRDFGEAEQLANKIKDLVESKFGITCSVGVASNKVVAKIAAGVNKPNGLKVVAKGREREFLSQLPVRDLPNVGVKGGAKLEAIGVKTIGDLAKLSLSSLEGLFGPARARWLYDASKGVDGRIVAVAGQKKQVGRIATLAENTRNKGEIMALTARLCAAVWRQASQRGAFNSIGITCILEDLSVHSKSRTVAGNCASERELLQVAGELADELLLATDSNWRRVGVRASGFGDLKQSSSQQRKLSSY